MGGWHSLRHQGGATSSAGRPAKGPNSGSLTCIAMALRLALALWLDGPAELPLLALCGAYCPPHHLTRPHSYHALPLSSSRCAVASRHFWNRMSAVVYDEACREVLAPACGTDLACWMRAGPLFGAPALPRGAAPCWLGHPPGAGNVSRVLMDSERRWSPFLFGIICHRSPKTNKERTNCKG